MMYNDLDTLLYDITLLGAVAATNGYIVTTIPTNIDAVNCVGTETSILDCTIKYGGVSSTCEQSADAGIICQGK